MAAGQRTGLDCFLYYNTGTYGTPVWTAIPAVGDLSTDHTKDKAEVKSRTSRWAMNLPLHKHAPLSFQLRDDTSDATRTALRDAWINDTSLDLAIADAAIATSGTEYFRADYYCFEFKKSQPIGGPNMADVALDLALSNNAQAFTTVGS